MAEKNEFHSFTILLLSIFLFPTLALCLDPEIQNQIDKIITENVLPNNHIPGLGLSIVSENGESVWAKGYGLRDVENSINATGDTKFVIGSISKSFTATLVVKTLSELYPEKGAGVLDIPIRKLHPASNFTLSDRFRSESTTFRDMLSHRTCLLPEQWGIIVAGSFKTVDEFLFRQRFAPEVCPFRTNFVYNNGIVAQAGETIAAIANSTLDAMFTKLFEDIGMSSTTIVRRTDDYDSMVNMSRAYYRKDGQTYRFNTELLKKVSIAPGSGGIISTPNDMAKYLLFHLNKGKVGSEQVVSEEAMNWIVQSANPEPPGLNFRTHKDEIISGVFSYGLGVSIGIYDGWEKISHDGYLAPFYSFLSFYPGLKIGVFTSSNGPGIIDRSIGHEDLHSQIFEILTGTNTTGTTSIKKKTPTQSVNEKTRQNFLNRLAANSKKSPRVDVKLENMTGVFGNPQSGDFEATIMNGTGNEPDRLYFRSGEWGTGFLNPLPGSNSTFSVEWDSDVVQEMYAEGSELYELYVDFSDINEPVAFLYGMSMAFVRDLTIDKLSNQPWDPDSCGPAS